MKRFYGSILEKPIWLVFFSGLYPAVFFLSNNWFACLKSEIVLLLFTTFFLILCGYGVLFAIFRVIRKFTFKGIDPGSKPLNALSAGYAFAVVSFLMSGSFEIFAGSKTAVICLMVGAAISAGLAAYKWGIKYFNLFIVLMVAMAGFEWGYSYIGSRSIIKDDWFAKTKVLNDKIVLKEKPNIYFFLLESYHNSKTLKAIYDFDNQEMVNTLEKRDFIVRDDVYSNYQNTLASVASIFTMQHHYYRASSGKDDAIGVRDIIGNKEYNAIISILKNNAYKIQYICHSNYMFRSIKDIDFVFPQKNIVTVFKIYQNPIINDVIFKTPKKKRKKKRGKFGIFAHTASETHRKKLERLSVAYNSKAPYFTFIKMNRPAHFGKTWDAIPEKRIARYFKNLKKTNNLLLKYMNDIMENDPEGVIVLIGDHGAFRYRGAKVVDHDFSLPAGRIPASTLALDRFGTFFAIRSTKVPVQMGTLSHVNLFRHIFASLAGNDDPLKSREADESYIPDYGKKRVNIAVQNGSPLQTIIKKEFSKQ
ncbi:MAG: hypothetical protein GY729_09125 [Desulfobacteraceae bacterium]|nr:hypothetical protein [Desulfobacteraceae bacterium]